MRQCNEDTSEAWIRWHYEVWPAAWLFIWPAMLPPAGATSVAVMLCSRLSCQARLETSLVTARPWHNFQVLCLENIYMGRCWIGPGVVLLEDSYSRVVANEGYNTGLKNLISVVHCGHSSDFRMSSDPCIRGVFIALPYKEDTHAIDCDWILRVDTDLRLFILRIDVSVRLSCFVTFLDRINFFCTG